MPTKVAILTPIFSDPKTDYVRALLAMLAHTAEHRPDLVLRPRLAQGQLIQNRNLLANDALEWGADFTLWIDADMSFPPETLVTLIGHGLTVVGCNYPMKTQPPQPTAIRRDGERQIAVFSTPEIAKTRPVEEVESMGLGLCLIAAPVLRALERPIIRALPDHPAGIGEDRYLFQRIAATGEGVFLDRVELGERAHAVSFAWNCWPAGISRRRRMARERLTSINV